MVVWRHRPVSESPRLLLTGRHSLQSTGQSQERIEHAKQHRVDLWRAGRGAKSSRYIRTDRGRKEKDQRNRSGAHEQSRGELRQDGPVSASSRYEFTSATAPTRL